MAAKDQPDDVRLPSLEEIVAAQRRIEGAIVRTRLVRLNTDLLRVESDSCCPLEIYLKLENEQVCGAFKTRGALNYLSQRTDEELKGGLVTASTGSFAQGLAWCAKQRNVTCTAIVPDFTDHHRSQLLEEAGATVQPVFFPTWWETMEGRNLPHDLAPKLGKALFVHQPSTDTIAGDATIAMEILEDLPDVDCIVTTFGTGSLLAGVMQVIKARKPGVRIFAVEVETSTPLTTAQGARRPEPCNHVPSFATQVGGESVLSCMWNNLQHSSVINSTVVRLDQVADAVRTLLECNQVRAEGSGAASVAAALHGLAGGGKIVCIVTGGNISDDMMSQVLAGEVPPPGLPILPEII